MEAASFSIPAPDPSIPTSYWNQLSNDDKAEFIKLRNRLHQTQKTSVKDRRLVSFSNEMILVLNFLEHDNKGREQRCVLTGVAFAGPYICVNTRLLKNFLGRCKSSINGSLQQLGYVAVRTKSKARSCVVACIPCLGADPNLLRQWTVRGASADALFCFVSKYPPEPLPTITQEDLNEDRKSQNSSRIVNQHVNLNLSASKQQQQQNKTILQPQQKIQNIIRSALSQQQKKMMNNLSNTGSNSFSSSTISALSNSLSSSFSSAFSSALSTRDISNNNEIDLPSFGDYKFSFNDSSTTKIPDMTPSFSVDYLSAYNYDDDGDWIGDFARDYENDWNIQSHRAVPRSQSAFFTPQNEWGGSIDDSLYF
ncbi:hypothetical protein TRFO_31013 [Tritrichomonas foetus]|uniref:Initiator binding domain-containing protein n=1 Tax=Tritrichomonas foetus TaxID=1144522 RepID=A0A1J4JWT1_9EUKA|nr:hypothetical protein TRFO_31013 [Tritrichomonas foetus]|eukprot:OHT01996.1 hypothetical protein TRFO_31013 [Tritrichomonas foetus]